MAAEKKEYYDGYLINNSSSSGYPTIWINNRNTLLHRYVWEKYNGKIPKGYHIHHKGENKHNYNLNNLEMISFHEHRKYHAIKSGLGKGNKGKLKTHDSGFCKGATPVILIRENIILEFESVTRAAQYLNCRIDSVSRVLRGRRNTVRGYKVFYKEGANERKNV